MPILAVIIQPVVTDRNFSSCQIVAVLTTECQEQFQCQRLVFLMYWYYIGEKQDDGLQLSASVTPVIPGNSQNIDVSD